MSTHTASNNVRASAGLSLGVARLHASSRTSKVAGPPARAREQLMEEDDGGMLDGSRTFAVACPGVVRARSFEARNQQPYLASREHDRVPRPLVQLCALATVLRH